MDVIRLYKTTFGKITPFIFAVVLLFSQVQSAFAADGGGDAKKGKTLFQDNCSACHNPIKPLVGPALQGVVDEIPGGMDWVYKWVHNSSAVIASGDKYAVGLFNQYKVQMTAFPQLSEEDIDDIFAYVDSFKPAGAPAAGAGTAAGTAQVPAEGGNNNILFGVLTLVLAVLALILMQVNSSLHRLANEKEGVPNRKPIPFYRNKRYILTVAVILFVLAGYFLVSAANTVGYNTDYQPKQPVFFSHKVHAGINQINCLYCHAGAEKSRHAMIPSPNICMNCHKAINSYTGSELQTADGKVVDGTAEIQKLYEYVGWDPNKNQYTKAGHPIEWVKIHNLPDYVYFNHSQHVAVGKVQCQTCHGPIQDENEVYQFATLGMGWCVNCHRTTKVQFTDNNYYSIFTKFHEELANHQIDSVTVEMEGGTECQKCHY